MIVGVNGLRHLVDDMASQPNIEYESAKFLQKLIQDSKDEPDVLAKKLYLVLQRFEAIGKENSFPYQIRSWYATPFGLTSEHAHPTEILFLGSATIVGPALIGPHLATLWLWMVLCVLGLLWLVRATIFHGVSQTLSHCMEGVYMSCSRCHAHLLRRFRSPAHPASSLPAAVQRLILVDLCAAVHFVLLFNSYRMHANGTESSRIGSCRGLLCHWKEEEELRPPAFDFAWSSSLRRVPRNFVRRRV